MKFNIGRMVLLYALWLSLISAILLLAMGNVLPFRPIAPEHVFTWLLEGELFFVLVVWPFFIPKLLTPGPAPLRSLGSSEAHVLVLQVIVLFVVALPLALVSQNLSEVPVADFFVGHLLVAALACFVAAIFVLAGERTAKITPWYYLGFFVASGLLPFLHYVTREVTGASLGWLAVLSPFWGAARLENGAALASALLFGVAAVGLFLAAPFLRKVTVAGSGSDR